MDKYGHCATCSSKYEDCTCIDPHGYQCLICEKILREGQESSHSSIICSETCQAGNYLVMVLAETAVLSVEQAVCIVREAILAAREDAGGL